MASSSYVMSLFLVLLAVSSTFPIVRAIRDLKGDPTTHIHLYIHETLFPSPNATATFLPSPLGSNSTFGSLTVVDDEVRKGPVRASSELVGRFQGIALGTGLLQPGFDFLSSATLVFTAGKYAGSTLSVQNHVRSFTETFERAIVGGSGSFRLAQGYSITKFLGNPTSDTGLWVIDLFVLMQPGNY